VFSNVETLAHMSAAAIAGTPGMETHPDFREFGDCLSPVNAADSITAYLSGLESRHGYPGAKMYTNGEVARIADIIECGLRALPAAQTVAFVREYSASLALVADDHLDAALTVARITR
jgi:hypothetical protein